MSIITSSQVSAGDTITAAERNALRKDVLQMAGDHAELGGSTGTAYVLTLNATIVAYVTGAVYKFYANVTNTGAVTLNINSIGAKSIIKPSGAALQANDIISGAQIIVIYESVADSFILQTPSGRAVDQNDFVAKGDLLSASAAGTMAVKTLGAANKVLRVENGASAETGLIYQEAVKIAIATSDVTVENTLTETALVTTTLAAGVLDTANAVKLKLFVIDFDIADTDTLTLDLQYGATTIATISIANGSGGAFTNMKGWIEAVIYASGATNTQEGIIQAKLQQTGFLTTATNLSWFDNAVGTGAENSATALTLRITAQWDAAVAANKITVANAYIEAII